MFDDEYQMLRSSANRALSMLLGIESVMSLKYMLNRVGDKQLPWGTPLSLKKN